MQDCSDISYQQWNATFWNMKWKMMQDKGHYKMKMLTGLIIPNMILPPDI
jgi:hypothetical protein